MTKYVVDRLVDEFSEHQTSVDCFRIERARMSDISLSEYDTLGIAYPVHAFNAPEIVVNFVKQLPKSNGMDVVIVHTGGEDNKANYASSDLIIKKLRRKGYTVFYNRFIEMPSNFIVKYNAVKVSGILEKAGEDIPLIVRDIIGRVPYFMRKNFIAKILAAIGKAEWPGARILGKFFYANSSCTRCGKCVDDCPNMNIAMTEKTAVFGWRCGLCMRCVYKCPENAIDVHKPFGFIRFDEWYFGAPAFRSKSALK